MIGGIHASTVCPMHTDGSIDEAALDSHLAAVLACSGIAGLLVNGHAGEGAALDRAEAQRVVARARAAAGERRVVAGVTGEASGAAAAQAEDAVAAGADAIMVFPPFSWALGADPRTVLRYHQAVHDATGLPLLLFQGPARAGGLCFPPALLSALVRLPRVAAIKEGGWDSAAYDACCRTVAAVRPDVAVLASGDEHLFACMAAGSPGSLVSLACLVPELVVDLAAAVSRADLAAARALHARVQPLAAAIYSAPPAGLTAPRLKTCLHLLGRLPSAACRPPLPPLDPAEQHALAAALQGALA